MSPWNNSFTPLSHNAVTVPLLLSMSLKMCRCSDYNLVSFLNRDNFNIINVVFGCYATLKFISASFLAFLPYICEDLEWQYSKHNSQSFLSSAVLTFVSVKIQYDNFKVFQSVNTFFSLCIYIGQLWVMNIHFILWHINI